MRRGRPPGSKNRSNSDRDISALRISSKRAREFPTEPRKRLQSRPNSTSPQSVNKPFTHGAPASGKVNGSAVGSPLPLGTEMQIYLQTLTQRFHGITNMPGRQGIQVELPRLELLLDACEKSDHFYLLLHQLFCYDHQIRKSDETIPGLLDMYRPGLKVVSFLLLSNNNLTPDAVTWFSSFPMPLGSLIFRVPEFQSAHAQVLRCLERIAGNWESMRTQCTRRKYPPLVDELVCLFNVESHVFQQIIFRGVLRDIWPGEQDSCFRSTEDKFEKDYKYVMLRLQMNPGPPIESITVYQDTLVESYHQIFRSHQQHMGPMRAAVNQAGSPRVTMALPQGGQPRQAPININPKRRTLSQSGRPADTTNFSPMSSGSLAAQRPHVSDQLRTSSPSVTIPPAALLTAESQHHQVLTQLYNGLSSPQINNIVQSPTTTPSFQIMGIAADGPRPPNGQHHDRHISGSGVESAVNHPLIDNNQIPNQLTTTTLHIPRVVPSNAPGDILTCHMQRRFDVQSQSQNTSPPSLHYGPHAFVQTRPQAGIQRSLTRQGSETNLTASRSNQFIRPNDSPRQAHPNPGSSTISALHQAYVRSPVLLPLDVNETPNITMSYFITIQHVIMPPRELSDGNRHVKWDFTIAKEFVDVLARDVAGFQGAPATRKLLPGSRLCRIRCIRLNNTAGLPTQSEWAVADNVWPGNTAVILNGLALEIRKKWHHGKDLPIDVTPYIKEGQNNLASAMGFPQDSKSRYAIGIEILQVVDDQQVKAGIKMLPWEEARKRIIDQSSTSDPDVEIVESQIILDLTDPYTSKMFDVPIRGQLCRHNQCFDRDIYLQTRSVSRAPGGPCGPDEFRCPICGVDARPQSLLVDGFFAAIRHELLTKGRPDVKAIVLREDGSWEIKEQEEATGETGDGTGKKSVPPDKTSVRNAPAARQSTPRDFIELE